MTVVGRTEACWLLDSVVPSVAAQGGVSLQVVCWVKCEEAGMKMNTSKSQAVLSAGEGWRRSSISEEAAGEAHWHCCGDEKAERESCRFPDWGAFQPTPMSAGVGGDQRNNIRDTRAAQSFGRDSLKVANNEVWPLPSMSPGCLKVKLWARFTKCEHNLQRSHTCLLQQSCCSFHFNFQPLILM